MAAIELTTAPAAFGDQEDSSMNNQNKTQAETMLELFKNGARDEATRLCIASSLFTDRTAENFVVHRFLDGSYLKRGRLSDLNDWQRGQLEGPPELYSFTVLDKQQGQVYKCREAVSIAVDEMLFADPDFFAEETSFEIQSVNRVVAAVESKLDDATGVGAFVNVHMCAFEFAYFRYWKRKGAES